MAVVSNQDIQDFYYELGRFFFTFASVEMHLRMALTGVSRADEQTAKALFYSTRVEDGSTMLKRIYKARGAEAPANLTNALQQLSYINTARNSLVHHGVIFGEDFETSNWAVILSPEDERKIPVPPATLQAMTRDLHVILNVLGAVSRGEEWANAVLTRHQLYAWLYKPPEQGGKSKAVPAKKPKSNRRKPAPPPQSSEG